MKYAAVILLSPVVFFLSMANAVRVGMENALSVALSVICLIACAILAVDLDTPENPHA